MTGLLLAASILGSVPAAVEKTLQDQPPLELITRQEFEARLGEIKRVADSTASCVREGFVLAGADIMSGAAAWRFCEECEEANPLGVDKEGRLGMKVAQLGFVIERCYAAAKNGKQVSGVVKWINRIVTGLVVANNAISAAKGTPLIRWGTK